MRCAHPSPFFANASQCYSRGVTAEQTCTVVAHDDDDDHGRFVYVVVDGDDAFGGVSLVCRAVGGQGQPPSPSPTVALTTVRDATIGTTLRSGVAVTDIDIPVRRALFWTMTMPARAESVTCSISGGNHDGDADLYARWDAEIDLNDASVNQVGVPKNMPKKNSHLTSILIYILSRCCLFNIIIIIISAPQGSMAARKPVTRKA